MPDDTSGVIPRSTVAIPAPAAKVVPMRGDRTPVEGAASPTVVRALEELLAEARRGEISCFGIALVSPSGWCNSVIAESGGNHCHHLVAACGYLMRRMQDKAMDAP